MPFELPELKFPDPVARRLPPSPLPLPRSLFLFTCASLFGSCLLLIISMLDLGYLSMWLNPCASIFTIIYHVGMLLISRRQRSETAPSYFSTTIFTGYLLTLVWFVAFILTVVVIASGHVEHYKVEWLRQHGLPATVHSQRFQILLTLYQMFVVGGMAVKGHTIVEREGPDPYEWRNLEHNKVCSSVPQSANKSVYEVRNSPGRRNERDHEMIVGTDLFALRFQSTQFYDDLLVRIPCLNHTLFLSFRTRVKSTFSYSFIRFHELAFDF
jgi:hypothetical protein